MPTQKSRVWTRQSLREKTRSRRKEEEEEVGELITESLCEIDNVMIVKELDGQSSINVNLQKDAETKLDIVLDKLKMCAPCNCSCKEYYEEDEYLLPSSNFVDDASLTSNTDQSVYSGQEKGSRDEVSGNGDKLDASKEVAVDDYDYDDDDILDHNGSNSATANNYEEDTTGSFDEASLASEYDDYKKALKLLKNRATRQGMHDKKATKEKGIVEPEPHHG